MEFVRRWVRRHTRPIPRKKARYYHDKLSVVYYMSAWTAAGIALFHVLTQDPKALPQELNIHADPEELVKPAAYKAADLVKIHQDDIEVRLISMKNFTFKSNEPYKSKKLVEVKDEMNNRATADFFGDNSSNKDEKDLSC